MALSKVTSGYYGAIIHNSTARGWVTGCNHRKSVKNSLVTHLIDPKTNDEVLILGTSNVSTVHAHRTLEQVKSFNPSSVLLQVSPIFPKYISGNFISSEDFQSHLKDQSYHTKIAESFYIDNGIKSSIFALRATALYSWLNFTLRTPSDFWRFFMPGLDYKFVQEFADDKKLPVHYAGEDFDAPALELLRRDTRLGAVLPFWRYHFGMSDAWKWETRNMQVIFRSHSVKAIAEGHLTQDNVAWLNGLMETLVPVQKHSLIDKRDEDIFWAIEKKMTGKKKLVIVNQWHMDGVQRFWRKSRGLEGKTEPVISTHDLPLVEIQTWMRGLDHDRKVVEERTGYPMASHSKDLTPYWDETRSHYA